MSIGKIDSVGLAAIRQAPAPAPDSAGQRAAQNNPVFPPTQGAVVAAVQAANSYAQSVSSSVQFSFDQDSGRTVVKMVDTATDEVLRQFPSEEILAISKSIDRMQGLLINREA